MGKDFIKKTHNNVEFAETAHSIRCNGFYGIADRVPRLLGGKGAAGESVCWSSSYTIR